MTEAERIEKEADEYIKQFLPHVDTTGHWLGYIAGATAVRQIKDKDVIIQSLIMDYVTETKAEHERLQQQLKENDEKIKELEYWKKSEIELWLPIIEYMQNNPHLAVGDSISKTTLQVLKEYYDGGLKSAQELNKELVEALSEWVEVAKRKYPPKDSDGIALLKHYESLINKSKSI